jgi:hypothetical protein
MIYIILAYLTFVLFFSIFSYFALYHIWRFGFVGDVTKMVVYGYIIISIIIIITSFVLILIA